MADLFIDRFNSKAVASAYAAFNICVALLLLGGGTRGSFEVCSAMIVKPESAIQIGLGRNNGFREYQHLRPIAASLNPEQQKRYDVLDNLSKHGELSASISYIKMRPVLLLLLPDHRDLHHAWRAQGRGHHRCRAGRAHSRDVDHSDPRGTGQGRRLALAADEAFPKHILAGRDGGVERICLVLDRRHHLRKPDSDHRIITQHVGGRIGDQRRYGALWHDQRRIYQRLVLIGWMFCGLLAMGMLSGKISEPDQAWAALSKLLLGPGLMGLMLSRMLLGHMPSVGLSSVGSRDW